MATTTEAVTITVAVEEIIVVEGALVEAMATTLVLGLEDRETPNQDVRFVTGLTTQLWSVGIGMMKTIKTTATSHPTPVQQPMALT